MRLFKRQGTNAWFLAAYRVGSQRPAKPDELKVTEVGGQHMTIRLAVDGKVYEHRVPRLLQR
jgi:hypothetical protein